MMIHTVEMGKAPIPWRERLVRDVDTDCWLFSGSLNSDGYGNVRIGGRKGKTVKTHRLAWEEFFGPIPDGLRVCHRCDVPSCCNPDHLFLGTQRDNVTDMVSKGRFRGRASLNAVKTHCPSGHEYTPENTYLYRGMRSCKTCSNERALAFYYRKKA